MASHTLQDIEVTNQDCKTGNIHNNQNLNLKAEYVQEKLPKPTTIELVGGIFCHICELTYGKKKEFEVHYAQHGSGEEIVYTCVVCHKQLKSYPSYRGHCYTTHVIKCRNKCEHCSKYFSKNTVLMDHIKTMHTFNCSTCKKEFSSKHDLQLHQLIHNSTSPPYHCKLCAVKFPSLDSCQSHAEAHAVFIYFCPICNENITDKGNASEHLLKHFDKVEDDNTLEVVQNSGNQETSVERLGGISCCYCPVVFKNRVDFDSHFSYDHGDKDIVYICTVCDKEFEKYSAFGDHAYNHFTKDRYCCSICQKTYSRLSLLATHMAACQADSAASGKPFACSECAVRYATEQRLRRHLQEAHGMYCIRCPVESCRKIFTTPKALMLHQYVHNPHRNWCRQCGLLFTSMTSCERHLDMHTQKLYSCPICSKNYGEKYLLTKHITQHFESILHICKVCGKAYDSRRRFMDHTKTHSEKQVHKCTYCDKGFHKLSHLQQHLNTHTGSKPFKCTICTRTFASFPNWAKHKRRMHNLKSKMYGNQAPTSDDEIDDPEIVNKVDVTDNDGKNNIENSNLHTPKNNEKLIEMNSKKIMEEVKFQDSTVRPETIVEPETIDHIDIENELQLLENMQEKENNVDLGFVNVLATSETIFDNASTAAPPNLAASSEASYPREYGPEFSIGDSCGILDLDDHMLPHIDPLLTIKTDEFNNTHHYTLLPPSVDAAMYQQYQQYQQCQEYQVTPQWEPPLFTKVCQEYGGMVDSNRLSIMNTDIF